MNKKAPSWARRQSSRRQKRLLSPRTTDHQLLPSSIIVNLVDNPNGREGIPTTLTYNYAYRIAHPQSHDEIFAVSNQNRCQSTTGDHNKSHTLLFEDPNPSGFTT